MQNKKEIKRKKERPPHWIPKSTVWRNPTHPRPFPLPHATGGRGGRHGAVHAHTPSTQLIAAMSSIHNAPEMDKKTLIPSMNPRSPIPLPRLVPFIFLVPERSRRHTIIVVAATWLP